MLSKLIVATLLAGALGESWDHYGGKERRYEPCKSLNKFYSTRSAAAPSHSALYRCKGLSPLWCPHTLERSLSSCTGTR